MKCQFCGKEFKTETGFKKHSCEKKLRYENPDNNAYMAWYWFMSLNHLKMPKEDKLMTFVKSPYYKMFEKFSKWISEYDISDTRAFMEFVKDMNVAQKYWMNDNTYKAFIHWFIKQEHRCAAIDRSKKYLESNNLTLETISQNKLYFSLLSGSISKKYLTENNYDAKAILDEIQIKDLGDLI